MKTGDRVIYNGIGAEVLEVDDSIEDVSVHIMNDAGIGYCVLLTELMKQNDNIN